MLTATIEDLHNLLYTNHQVRIPRHRIHGAIGGGTVAHRDEILAMLTGGDQALAARRTHRTATGNRKPEGRRRETHERAHQQAGRPAAGEAGEGRPGSRLGLAALVASPCMGLRAHHPVQEVAQAVLAHRLAGHVDGGAQRLLGHLPRNLEPALGFAGDLTDGAAGEDGVAGDEPAQHPPYRFVDAVEHRFFWVPAVQFAAVRQLVQERMGDRNGQVGDADVSAAVQISGDQLAEISDDFVYCGTSYATAATSAAGRADVPTAHP